jgi:hypothetical protein
MPGNDRFERAWAATALLQQEIDERYTHGRLVAVAGGKLVANAESFEGLKVALTPLGLGLDDVAILQAGVEQKIEYLGWMTTSAQLGHWIKCVLPAGAESPGPEPETDDFF